MPLFLYNQVVWRDRNRRPEDQAGRRGFRRRIEKLYGSKLNTIILYEPCARGDYTDDGDIDILLLLNAPVEELGKERRRILDVAENWILNTMLCRPLSLSKGRL